MSVPARDTDAGTPTTPTPTTSPIPDSLSRTQRIKVGDNREVDITVTATMGVDKSAAAPYGNGPESPPVDPPIHPKSIMERRLIKAMEETAYAFDDEYDCDGDGENVTPVIKMEDDCGSDSCDFSMSEDGQRLQDATREMINPSVNLSSERLLEHDPSDSNLCDVAEEKPKGIITTINGNADDDVTGAVDDVIGAESPMPEDGKAEGVSKVANIEGLEFDGNTVLCRVCGDKASGFHYGVHACEGCKGFFRRSIQQKIQYRPCLKNQQCNIMRVNRNRCQYCRLKKCIAVGMSRDAVRFGRVPKREKAKIMEQMRRVNAQAQIGLLSSIIENEAMFLQKIIASHLEMCDFTRNKFQHFYEKAWQTVEYVNCPAHMACPLNPVPNSTEGIKKWDEFSDCFTPAIRNVVNFAKCIPGFQVFSQEDQVTLLKAGVFEVLLVHLACLFDNRTSTMMFANGKLYKKTSHSASSSAGFLLDSMFDFAERLNQLELTDEEIALFSALVITAPDRPGLRYVDQISRVQQKISQGLQTMMNTNHPDDTTFSKLLMKIPDLRTLNTLHSEKLLGLTVPQNGNGAPAAPEQPQRVPDWSVDRELKPAVVEESSTETIPAVCLVSAEMNAYSRADGLLAASPPRITQVPGGTPQRGQPIVPHQVSLDVMEKELVLRTSVGAFHRFPPHAYATGLQSEAAASLENQLRSTSLSDRKCEEDALLRVSRGGAGQQCPMGGRLGGGVGGAGGGGGGGGGGADPRSASMTLGDHMFQNLQQRIRENLESDAQEAAHQEHRDQLEALARYRQHQILMEEEANVTATAGSSDPDHDPEEASRSSSPDPIDTDLQQPIQNATSGGPPVRTSPLPFAAPKRHAPGSGQRPSECCPKVIAEPVYPGGFRKRPFNIADGDMESKLAKWDYEMRSSRSSSLSSSSSMESTDSAYRTISNPGTPGAGAGGNPGGNPGGAAAGDLARSPYQGALAESLAARLLGGAHHLGGGGGGGVPPAILKGEGGHAPLHHGRYPHSLSHHHSLPPPPPPPPTVEDGTQTDARRLGGAEGSAAGAGGGAGGGSQLRQRQQQQQKQQQQQQQQQQADYEPNLPTLKSMLIGSSGSVGPRSDPEISPPQGPSPRRLPQPCGDPDDDISPRESSPHARTSPAPLRDDGTAPTPVARSPAPAAEPLAMETAPVARDSGAAVENGGLSRRGSGSGSISPTSRAESEDSEHYWMHKKLKMRKCLSERTSPVMSPSSSMTSMASQGAAPTTRTPTPPSIPSRHATPATTTTPPPPRSPQSASHGGVAWDNQRVKNSNTWQDQMRRSPIVAMETDASASSPGPVAMDTSRDSSPRVSAAPSPASTSGNSMTSSARSSNAASRHPELSSRLAQAPPVNNSYLGNRLVAYEDDFRPRAFSSGRMEHLRVTRNRLDEAHRPRAFSHSSMDRMLSDRFHQRLNSIRETEKGGLPENRLSEAAAAAAAAVSAAAGARDGGRNNLMRMASRQQITQDHITAISTLKDKILTRINSQENLNNPKLYEPVELPARAQPPQQQQQQHPQQQQKQQQQQHPHLQHSAGEPNARSQRPEPMMIASSSSNGPSIITGASGIVINSSSSNGNNGGGGGGVVSHSLDGATAAGLGPEVALAARASLAQQFHSGGGGVPQQAPPPPPPHLPLMHGSQGSFYPGGAPHPAMLHQAMLYQYNTAVQLSVLQHIKAQAAAASQHQQQQQPQQQQPQQQQQQQQQQQPLGVPQPRAAAPSDVTGARDGLSHNAAGYRRGSPPREHNPGASGVASQPLNLTKKPAPPGNPTSSAGLSAPWMNGGHVKQEPV